VIEKGTIRTKYDALRAAVVRRRDGAKAFLTRRILHEKVKASRGSLSRLYTLSRTE